MSKASCADISRSSAELLQLPVKPTGEFLWWAFLLTKLVGCLYIRYGTRMLLPVLVAFSL
nr:MAG TPA: hypothetical protein [Caudoviricetes sp.]